MKIMYYTVYQTTNKVNNKKYIGVHRTEDPMDNYLGSGKYLKIAIEKHGVSNFEKEILHFCDSEKEMFTKEKELVTEEVVKNRNFYNATVGGDGGFYHINSNLEKYPDLIKYAHEGLKQWVIDNPDKVKQISSLGGKSVAEKRRKEGTLISHMKLMSAAQKSRPKPKLKEWIWITNGIVDKRIHNSEELPNGWKKGKLNKHIKRKKIERNCIVCGKKFITVPSLNKKSCSRRCANISKTSKFKMKADSDLAEKVPDSIADKL